jgi:high-affinity Fe2+/Pb2+ permease
MILALLAAAASSSGRSVAGWVYDVSKSVASAIVVAFGVAVVGKGIGWGTFTRLKWTALVWVAVLVAVEMVIIVGAILSGAPDSLADVFRWSVLLGLACGIVAVFRRVEFLEPPSPPVVTSSLLESPANSDDVDTGGRDSPQTR